MKLRIAITAVAAAAALTFSATAAQAVVTRSASTSDGGASGWVQVANSTAVSYAVNDLACDGRGAVLHIKVSPNAWTTLSDGDGCHTQVTRSIFPVGHGVTISFYVCNVNLAQNYNRCSATVTFTS